MSWSIPLEVLVTQAGLGFELYGSEKDRQDAIKLYPERKAEFIAEVNNMPYMSKFSIYERNSIYKPPTKTTYYEIPIPYEEWKLVPEEYQVYSEHGDSIYGLWEINLWSDGAGNLVNWTRAQELIAAESTQGCNEGEKHASFYVRDYYNPFIEDFLDYERLTGGTPSIVGCCPEKFNGLQCVPNGTEFTKRTPQQLADFDCKVLKGINYVGVLDDPNHPNIDIPFSFSCKLNSESQAKVDFQDCMKQGGSYESCQFGTTTTTNNGVSDAIDYMMTIDEGGEDDEEEEEEEIETPPPDTTTTPPPTDTGMSDADRERLNNYRRRRF